MSGGTREGGLKAYQTNIERQGEDFYKTIGSAGGKKGTGHTFAHGKVDPYLAGKLGGAIGRQGRKKKLTPEEKLEVKKEFAKKYDMAKVWIREETQEDYERRQRINAKHGVVRPW